VTPDGGIEPLAAEVSHFRNRLALLWARIYSGNPTSETRLRDFERALESAEQRLRKARARPPR